MSTGETQLFSSNYAIVGCNYSRATAVPPGINYLVGLQTERTIIQQRLLKVFGLAPSLLRASIEMVGCGSDQGRRDIGTGGVAALRRGIQYLENADMGHKMPFRSLIT